MFISNFLTPLRGLHPLTGLSHGLRRGLHSFAASRLIRGSAIIAATSKDLYRTAES